MSDLIPDSSELQSILKKCHVFVDFLFSPATYMRKNVKVLVKKKKKQTTMGSKYCMNKLVGELLMHYQNYSGKKKEKRMFVDFLFSFLQVSHLLHSWDWNKINELLSLHE